MNVLTAAALDQPDWTKRTFQVRLTKEQVRHSPDVDSKKPVSRQQEIAMKEYHGWPRLLDGQQCGVPFNSTSRGRTRTKEDPHLRSVEDLMGYEVWAEDGEIGRLENFIVDENSWHIGYLDVKAGDWLHSRSVLIPTRWVKAISWADHRVNLHHSRNGL